MTLADITVNVFPLFGIIVLAFAAGWLLRAAQLKKNRKKILELEREMLSNHAEILELQKEKAALIKLTNIPGSPVISMGKLEKGNEGSNPERKLGRNP